MNSVTRRWWATGLLCVAVITPERALWAQQVANTNLNAANQSTGHRSTGSAPMPQTPTEAAMSDAVQKYLISKLGDENALWKAVTGQGKPALSTMRVLVEGSGVKLGNVHFGPDFIVDVKSTHNTLDNCNGSRPLVQAITLQGTTTNGGSWTTDDSTQLDTSRSLSVEWRLGYGSMMGVGGTGITGGYSFSDSESVQQASSAGGTTGSTVSWTESKKFSVPKGESVRYQRDDLAMTGTNATFMANASVRTDLPIRFVVDTPAFQSRYYGMNTADGAYISGLDNSPAIGGTIPGGDVSLGDRVIVSDDGAYVFGRETIAVPSRNGNVAVVAVGGSLPGQPKRLWNPIPNSTCPSPLDVVLTQAGDLQIQCARKVLYSYLGSLGKSAVSSGVHVCRYLTFPSNSTDGQLTCYERNPNAITDPAERQRVLAAPNFRSTPVSLQNYAQNTQRRQITYQKTLRELVGVTEPWHSFDFTGRFNGPQVLAKPNYCEWAFTLTPQSNKNGQQSCVLGNLIEVDEDGKRLPNQSAVHVKSPGKTIDDLLCPSTQVLLDQINKSGTKWRFAQ